MTKELEALNIIKNISLSHVETEQDENLDGEWEYTEYEVNDGTIEDNYPDQIDIIEKALLELKAIKESNPSEALEILLKARQVCDVSCVEMCNNCQKRSAYNSVKVALLKAQENEKALEIIFKKKVMIEAIIALNLQDYNDLVSTDEQLTPEESDIVKRWYAEWIKN